MERKEFKRKEEGTEVRRWVDEIGGRGGWKRWRRRGFLML